MRVASGTFGDSLKNSRVLFILDAIVINGAYILTSGVLLSGYAIFMGTGDFLTALLNNCSNYATILSVVSFWIFEKSRRRKQLLLSMNLISRTLMFIAAFLPLVFKDSRIGPVLLTVLAVLSETVWSIYRVGWIVWMMNVIPSEEQSRFAYFRTFIVRIFMAVVTISSGFLLDRMNKGYWGFFILFALSYALSLIDVSILTKIKDTGHTAEETRKAMSGDFIQPVVHKGYKELLIFTFLFYFCLMLASSFTPVYMIKYLKLDYSFITAASVLSSVAAIATNLFWGRVEEKRGFAFVIRVTALISAFELLVLTFVNRDTRLLLFLSSLIAGVGAGGFGVSIFTYRYRIMPENSKIIFEGWFYFAYGLGILTAPFAGNAVINLLPSFTNAVFANSKIQLLYLTAFVLISLLLAATYKLFSFSSHEEARQRSSPGKSSGTPESM